MSFSPHANFAKGLVTVAPSPATSGTSFTIDDASQFPSPGAVGYPVTIWPAGTQATPANAEIATVTGKLGAVLTVTRAQESTTARTVIVGDQVGMAITAGTLEAIEAAAGGGSSASLIHQASVLITDAQFKAWPTTPLVITGPTVVGRQISFLSGALYSSIVAAYGNVGVFLSPPGVTAIFPSHFATVGSEVLILLMGLGDPLPLASLIIMERRTPYLVSGGSPDVVNGATSAGDWAPVSITPAGTGMSAYLDNWDADYANDLGAFTGGDPANVWTLGVSFQVYDAALAKYLTTDESGWDEDARTFS